LGIEVRSDDISGISNDQKATTLRQRLENKRGTDGSVRLLDYYMTSSRQTGVAGPRPLQDHGGDRLQPHAPMRLAKDEVLSLLTPVVEVIEFAEERAYIRFVP
jgi:hypothetical protein